MDFIISAEILIFILGGLALFQLAFAAFLMDTVRQMRKSNRDQSRQIFGLVKKLEGLTAKERNQMEARYDKLLERLSNQIPEQLSEKAGSLIFELEGEILKRLAEIEPSIKSSEKSKRKMNELIRQMESLERELVELTVGTVRTLMREKRSELSAEKDETTIILAA